MTIDELKQPPLIRWEWHELEILDSNEPQPYEIFLFESVRVETNWSLHEAVRNHGWTVRLVLPRRPEDAWAEKSMLEFKYHSQWKLLDTTWSEENDELFEE